MRKPGTFDRRFRGRSRLLLIALISASAASHAGPYTLTDLGVPSGGIVPLYGTGLSSTGSVVGNDGRGAGFLFANGSGSVLAGGLPGSVANSSYAQALNASSVVVGGAVMTAQIPDGSPANHAFEYNAGSWIDLTPPGHYEAAATDINEAGLVTVSNSYEALALFGDPPYDCFVYSPGSGATPGALSNIGTFGSPGVANPSGVCEGSALNRLGQVTGASARDFVTPLRAFVYTAGSGSAAATMNDLGVLPGGQQSMGFAINDAGQVAGWASTCGDYCPHAFIYRPGQAGSTGTMTDLGTLPNGSSGPWSIAYGVNNGGQVVGASRVGTSMQVDGFLFDGSAMIDLNTLVAPSAWGSCFVTLTKGDAINDSGAILADGTDSCTGVQHVYLLQPPPNSPPANPCTTLTLSGGKYVLCHLPPFVAVCGVECALPQLPVIHCPQCQAPVQVTWNAPGLLGDHWIDGTSLSVRVPNIEQARAAASTLQFTLSSESRVQTPAQRIARVALPTSAGRLTVQSAKIVAPVVELSAGQAPEQLLRLFAGAPGGSAVHLTLPFHVMSARATTHVRLVRFDEGEHRWVEVSNQSVNAITQSITARVGAFGRYTVVSTSTAARR